MSDIWEPWTPEIGQSVMVLSRPECFYCREEHDREVGKVGVVTETKHRWPVDDDPDYLAHHYWVTLADETVGVDGENHYAAAELEPVS